MSVVAFRSEDDGLTWDYAGSIADASAAPESEEGPNENDLTLLADGRTLLCVVRLDAGDGPLHHPFRPYAKTTSSDGGRTWSKLTLLPEGLGSARPRLLRLGGGRLVLAGGRPSHHNQDPTLWTNEAGDGKEWIPHSISYWHNRLTHDESEHFTPAVNTSHFRESTCYTSLVATGEDSGFVTYSRSAPHSGSGGAKTFAMPFSFNSALSLVV